MADRDGGVVFEAGAVAVSEHVTRWLEGSAKGELAPGGMCCVISEKRVPGRRSSGRAYFRRMKGSF